MPGILEGYLTPAELCEQLGIVPKTLGRWHAINEAPPRTMIGRRPYYKRSSVEAWLASREQGRAA
jgi:predicted DNA-binding transcriptional regulator AlpA